MAAGRFGSLRASSFRQLFVWLGFVQNFDDLRQQTDQNLGGNITARNWRTSESVAASRLPQRFLIRMTQAPAFQGGVWLIEDPDESRRRVARILLAIGTPALPTFSSWTDLRDALSRTRRKPGLVFVEGSPAPSLRHELSQIQERSPATQFVFLTPCEGAAELMAVLNRLFFALATHRQTPPVKEAGEYGLTEREQEILTLMVRGLIKKEIADHLAVSYHTVNNHERNIYRKLNVHTRSAAVAKALLERLCY